jgi:hypothetical protein
MAPQSSGSRRVARAGKKQFSKRVTVGEYSNKNHWKIHPKDYPLIPVIEIPSIKVRWAKKNSSRMGSAMIVLTAIR